MGGGDRGVWDGKGHGSLKSWVAVVVNVLLISLLDLSAAFDTTDHILLHHVQHSRYN